MLGHFIYVITFSQLLRCKIVISQNKIIKY